MPRKTWSAHDERKFKAIVKSCTLSQGRKKGATKICKRIAAATVERDRGMASLRGRAGLGAIPARGMGAQLLSLNLGRLSTNREGLTFEEWRRAAAIPANAKGAHAAWAKGEDPSEWRATPLRGLGGSWRAGGRILQSNAEFQQKGGRTAIISNEEDPDLSPEDGEVVLGIYDGKVLDGDDLDFVDQEIHPSSAAARVAARRFGFDGLGALGCACDAPSGLAGRKKRKR